MIFIDASFLIGLINSKDQWHSQAHEIEPKIRNNDKIISNIILTETLNSISYLGGKIANMMYETILDEFKIEFLNNLEIYNDARVEFLKYDGTIGFSDCTTIVLMKKLGINEIVSFDNDFDKVNNIIRISNYYEF